MDCVSCLEPLPAKPPGPGRPRKYHPGRCAAVGKAALKRARYAASEPRRATCRLCADPVPPPRLYYCSEDCMRRFEVMHQRERNLIAAYSDTAGPEGTAVSAADLDAGMPPAAITWRVDRWLRIARLRRAVKANLARAA